jgi:hypothetical protein
MSWRNARPPLSVEVREQFTEHFANAVEIPMDIRGDAFKGSYVLHAPNASERSFQVFVKSEDCEWVDVEMWAGIV